METNPTVIHDRSENPDQQQTQFLLAILPALVVLTGAFVWFNWSSILYLLRTWWTQDDYLHGFLVPVYSGVLLWLRRDMLVPFTSRGSSWGLAFLGVWAFLRWAAIYFNIGTLPEFSMIPFLAGAVLFVGGWQAFLWAWPAIAFLVFMLPLPIAIQVLLSSQLQSIAARVSVYVIQTMGIPAVAVGHVIQLTEEHRLDVAQACSGLKMMMLFFAMCVGAAFLMKKPFWERALIVGSAIPIAVASNVIRIVLTAVLSEIAWNWPTVFDEDTATAFLHDWIGRVVMMPAGLLLLWAEMVLLSKLLVAPISDRPLIMGRSTSADANQQDVLRVVQRKRRR